MIILPTFPFFIPRLKPNLILENDVNRVENQNRNEDKSSLLRFENVVSVSG